MNEKVSAFLADTDNVKKIHKAIISRLVTFKCAIDHCSYTETAEDIFFRYDIPVPMGSPRYELKEQMWKLFTTGKFKD